MKIKTPGFSLIEVLICLFILSVMIGLVSASLLNVSPKHRLEKAVWEINSRLNYARYKAVFSGEKVRVRFEPPIYLIERFDEDYETWVLVLKNFPDGVMVKANNSPVFHPGGTVSNLASIYVSNSWGKYKVTVAITGRIKITLLEKKKGDSPQFF